jgi:hypothetical protein
MDIHVYVFLFVLVVRFCLKNGVVIHGSTGKRLKTGDGAKKIVRELLQQMFQLGNYLAPGGYSENGGDSNPIAEH